MTGFVLDVSVTMAWFFEDEGNEGTRALLHRLTGAAAVVPGLWPLEVANVLTLAERRGRSTRARIGPFLAALQALPIDVEPVETERVLGEVLALARGERLTAYDAAYLELSLRRGLPLATRDTALGEAARRRGVEVLP